MLFIRSISSSLLSLLCIFPAFAQSDSIVLFNWEHYLSEEVISAYEQQSGTSVEQVFFDDDILRDRTINRAQEGQLDIVVLDEIGMRNFQKSGKIIDLSQLDLSFMANIPPLWRQQCTNAGIPYFWGTLGLVYRKDIYATPPSSWDAILNPDEKTKGHILMMSDYTDMLMPSLFKQQLSLDQATPEQLKQVYSDLLSLIPDVLDFGYVLSYVKEQRENHDDVYIAMAYAGDEYALNNINPDYEWGFVTPSEGTVIWVDCLAILSNSDNQQQALNFIEFLNQPQVAARNAEQMGNNPTNPYSLELLKNSTNTTMPTQKQLDQAVYYTDVVNVSVTLLNRIANAVVDSHKRYHHDK